jgi:autotransporter-associated beta strand protein
MLRRIATLTALVAASLITNANAANRTWSSTAAGLGFWSSNTAWVGGTAPVANDDLLFTVSPVAGGTRTVTNDFSPNTQFNSISLINLYNLNGNAINLAGNVTNNASGAIATINLNSALQVNSTWFVGFSNGRIDVNGDISGSSGFIKAGPGSVRLQAGTKTYSGDTTVDGGTLDINVANALPFGAGKGNVAVNTGATLGLRQGININGLNGVGSISAFSSGTKGLVRQRLPAKSDDASADRSKVHGLRHVDEEGGRRPPPLRLRKRSPEQVILRRLLALAGRGLRRGAHGGQ